VKEHQRISEIVDGAEMLYTIGGRGNYYLSKSAKKGNSLYVGEAAGFQDPCMGFGILFAIESGFLAAKALNENLDYDKLWKQKLLPEIKLNFARRFFTSIFGSKIITFTLNNGPKKRSVKKTTFEKVFLNRLTIALFSKIQSVRMISGYK
jgi:flavin-dependent dehydrogenase